MSDYIFSSSDIQKSLIDTNQYKYVVLKNGVKLLLISDKNTDKSGCSLCVNVGSFDEPENLNGLAHFLEHLLFMGTTKYPDENEYMEYLSIHNGSSNAYTADDATVYYFDISNKYFAGGLDRFVNFFISPLFKSDSVDREISAVNSEFLCNVTNDCSRRYRLLQLCTKNNLEESRFSIGNDWTLRIENIREKVINFYNQKYLASRMVGVLYSNKEIKDIEKMVHIFEEIPNKFVQNTINNTLYSCSFYNKYINTVFNLNNIPVISQYKSDINIFKEEYKNKVIRLKSLQDTKRLDIYICTISSLINNNLYQVLVDNFLKEDIGCIKILKDLELSFDMKINIDNTKCYAIFNIGVYLTDKGYDNINVVLDTIENYLIKYDFKDDEINRMIDLNKINFMYKDKEDVIDIIDELSENLFRVPYKNILNFEYSDDLPSAELIKEVMKKICNRKDWMIILSSAEDFIKNDLITDDFIKNDLITDECSRDDFINDDCSRDDLITDDFINNDLITDECSRDDFINDDNRNNYFKDDIFKIEYIIPN